MSVAALIGPIVLAAALVAPANAPERVATIALVSAQPGVPAHWREALRRAVTESTNRTWVPPPAISLDEARVALGCAAWDDVCAGQVAATTGAAAGLVLHIAGAGVGLAVTVTEVRAGAGANRPAERLVLESRGAAALELARQFVRAASAGPVAFVTVEADEVGATVLVDGSSIGTAPARAALTPGAHTLVLRKEGKAPIQRSFSVAAGQNPSIVVTFNAAGPAVAITPTVGTTPTSHRDAAGPSDAQLGWTLTAVGAGALALSAVAGVPWLLAFSQPRPYPNPIQVYGGAVEYRDGERSRFSTDFALAAGGSLLAAGVGTLVLATGVSMLLGDADDASVATDAR